MVSEPEEEEDEDSPPLMGQTKQLSEWASGSADSDMDMDIAEVEVQRAAPHMPPTFPAGLVEDHVDEVRRYSRCRRRPSANSFLPCLPLSFLNQTAPPHWFWVLP